MQLGPGRHKIDVKSRAARRPFDHRLIVRETSFRMISEARAGIQELYGALARDEARNRRILDDVIALLEEGRSPIVLTERRDHLQFLAEELRNFARHVVVLRGGMTGKERRRSADQLASIPNNEERVILATGRYIGECFDHPRLDTLLLAMPISWRGTLIQYSGRLHRYFLGKTEVRIYDYVDSGVPVLLRMFEKRLRTYRAIGYARDEAPLGFGEPPEENFVEYDDEALRHFERTV
jgi:superfamily II DNA or RNA helicase